MSNPNRKQLGVCIDVDLWRKFRAKAMEQGNQAGLLLEQIIREYLTKQADREAQEQR